MYIYLMATIRLIDNSLIRLLDNWVFWLNGEKPKCILDNMDIRVLGFLVISFFRMFGVLGYLVFRFLG